MAKTLIDIDEDLLAQAAKFLGTSTKKDTVNAVLSEYVKRRLRLEHLDYLSSADAPDLLSVREEAWR